MAQTPTVPGRKAGEGAASSFTTRDGTQIYPGAPHGLATTHKDPLNADLLAFLKA